MIDGAAILEKKRELVRLLEEQKRRITRNKLARYNAYPKQREFHEAGARYRERLLMAANRFGKSECGAAEMSYHLTGRYPDDWTGKRFTRPIRAWAAGITNETTRDIVQAKLIGPPGRKEDWGTGFIPGDCLGEISPARGIADAIDIVMVKHVSGGWSMLQFKSYERGREKWQGVALEVIWLDEEPPEDIYFEALTRTNETGGIVFLTFTPLLGWSDVVQRFLGDGTEEGRKSHRDRAVIMATIEDALHFSAEDRQRIIDSYPAHEREARTKGLPSMGKGRVFPVSEELITIDPLPAIPRHWVQIIGIDFGWDHPFAAAHLAWDRDADVVYVIKVYRVREQTPIYHAAALRRWGDWIPVAWPHDGLQHDKGSGEQLAAQYAQQGLALIAEKATFPDGTNGVEAGVLEMLDRMQTGRWKVYSTCREWFEEFRLYHRAPNASGKNVQIVKERDDALSASRYAMMMLRFARHEPLGYDDSQYNERRRSANSITGY